VAGSTEDSLRDFGATFRKAVAPKQVMVWAPDQIESVERSLRDADWWQGVVHFGSCLKSTAPGDRGAIYETGGSGIVGFYDFSGRAGKRRNQRYRYMAAGIYRPLAKPISYAELLDDERLEPLFRKIQSKAELVDEEAEAIVELAGRVPRFVTMPLPEWAEEVDGFFEWEPGTPDPTWASEHALHMIIATTPSLWKRLGFKKAPQIEVWSADRTCRYDLIGFAERVVVEVKLKGDVAALEQTDRYLDTLSRERGQDDWRAHIVVATSADSALRRATRQRPEVHVWSCERGTRAQKLVELGL
jgi:hypothetical protein